MLFFQLQGVERLHVITANHFHQFVRLSIHRSARLIEAGNLVPAVAALTINCLIHRNSIEPRADLAAFLELIAFDVQLHEGCLKYILRNRIASYLPTKKTEQRFSISALKFGKEGLVASFPVSEQQLLIRHLTYSFPNDTPLVSNEC
jgi:hypothetical protein